VEQLVEWRLAGETKVLGENLPQRHFVHHKSHMTRPGLEPWAVVVGIGLQIMLLAMFNGLWVQLCFWMLLRFHSTLVVLSEVPRLLVYKSFICMYDIKAVLWYRPFAYILKLQAPWNRHLGLCVHFSLPKAALIR
jgi:hypothetical protein